VGDGENIHKIMFPDVCRQTEPDHSWTRQDSVFAALATQLDAYFEGSLQEFNVPMAPNGTEFQQAVWDALSNVDYGETCSYRDIASVIGNPAATRAVGAANGANPIPIVIPCHRVVSANGTLTGFAGGLLTKHWLITHEAGEQSLFPFEEWLSPK